MNTSADTMRSGDTGVRRASASRLLALRRSTMVDDDDVSGIGEIDVMRIRHEVERADAHCRITADGVEMGVL